jgi:hypothetical protein
MQNYTSTKTKPINSNSAVQLELFIDSTELERNGLLVSGPIDSGSPHARGCWHCFSQSLWRHLVSLGNMRGPSVGLPICDRCYRKRARLIPSDRLLFDQACRQNAVEILGGAMACI